MHQLAEHYSVSEIHQQQQQQQDGGREELLLRFCVVLFTQLSGFEVVNDPVKMCFHSRFSLITKQVKSWWPLKLEKAGFLEWTLV